MRILVCFKTTPDYEALREADWAALAGGGGETKYARRVLNCYDESALELALRLADAAGPPGPPAGGQAGRAAPELAALSVAGHEADPHLRTLRALGFAHAARITSDADLDFAPATVAALIAGYVRGIGHSDVALLGCRCGPGDGGTVPHRVAEALGWPCLTQVTAVAAAERGRLRVTWTAGEALLRATVRPPCVLAVGNAAVSHLRVPTLKDRLAVRDEPVTVLSAADVGVDLAAELEREDLALLGLERVDRRRGGALVGGATPAEKARVLFETRLQAVLEGR